MYNFSQYCTAHACDSEKVYVHHVMSTYERYDEEIHGICHRILFKKGWVLTGMYPLKEYALLHARRENKEITAEELERELTKNN